MYPTHFKKITTHQNEADESFTNGRWNVLSVVMGCNAVSLNDAW